MPLQFFVITAHKLWVVLSLKRAEITAKVHQENIKQLCVRLKYNT